MLAREAGFTEVRVRHDLTGSSARARCAATNAVTAHTREVAWPRRSSTSTRCCSGSGTVPRRYATVHSRRSAGPERQRFIEQAERDFQDFAIVGDATWDFSDGVLTLRVDLRPPA